MESQEKEIFRQYLAAQGLKSTQQRELILDEFFNVVGPGRHTERNLDDLVEEGTELTFILISFLAKLALKALDYNVIIDSENEDTVVYIENILERLKNFNSNRGVYTI